MKIPMLALILLAFFTGQDALQAEGVSDQELCGTRPSETFIGWNTQDPQRIDVANRNTIRIVFRSLGGSFKSLPQLKVQEEYAGFECEPRSVRALWNNKALHKQGCFMAEIAWMPGGDWSGCKVQVHLPDSKEEAIIELFMRY